MKYDAQTEQTEWKHINVPLTKTQHAAIVEEAQARGLHMTQVVREIIMAWMMRKIEVKE